MFRCRLHVYFRAASFFLRNRCIQRLQHINFCSQAKIIETDINCKSSTEIDHTKLYELLGSTNPKPFEEIPLSNNESEDHPAEFIDYMNPPLPVSFNLAAYVNLSETLIKFVQLGVDLSEFDKDPMKAKYIITLDFEKHVKQHIQFLHDHGVKSDELGKFITKNPFIFKEDIENLQIRINYLQSKKFSKDAIARIVIKNPLVLSTTTKEIDARLGYFQKQFYFTGDEVRYIITKGPKLISYSHKKCLEKLFIFKELFGFTNEEMKKIILASPKIWMLGPRVLKERFNVIHNLMGIPHYRILEYPHVLLKRTFALKERHKYLVHLNRAQYDPEKPSFVSLFDIATTNDVSFCEKCAHTSIEKFNEFLKTI